MVSQSRSSGKTAPSYAVSAAILCSCMFSVAFLLLSPFPYSGFMAMQLVPGLDEEHVGPYAGLISSSFQIGRAVSSYHWGKLADIYGRRFVLISSLLLSAFFSLVFGCSPTFQWAIVSRFLLGLSNGVMSTVRTCVSELANGDNEKETHGMGVITAMFAWGQLLGPAIGGFLAEPITQYPDAHWLGGRLDGILTSFPFLVPNFVASILCIVSACLVSLYIAETLSDEKRRDSRFVLSDLLLLIYNIACSICRKVRSCFSSERTYIEIKDESNGESDQSSRSTVDCSIDNDLKILADVDCSECSSLFSSPSARKSFQTELRRPSTLHTQRMSVISDVTKEEKEHEGHSSESTLTSILQDNDVRDLMVIFWLSAFVHTSVAETFPLFCMSKEGGLGTNENGIGAILMSSGFGYVMLQYVIFLWLMKKQGLYGSMTVGSFVAFVPTIIITPFAVVLNNGAEDGNVKWTTVVFLGLLGAISSSFFSAFTTSVSIAINRAVDTTKRATVNGLTSLGGSVGRGLGPIVAGALYSLCVSTGIFPPFIGSVVAYAIISLSGALVTVLTCQLSEESNKTMDIRR